MTLTQYNTASSLDGFIADEHDSLDWLFEVPARGRQRFDRFLAEIGPIVMGATTYRWVLDHEQVLDRPQRWAEWYADRPTWVFTHRELPAVPGADIRFVHGDVRPVHADVVEVAGGRNIWLVGGGDLVGQFADHGLLDEIIVTVAPVTLGGGAPLLPRRLTGSVLTLAGATEVDGAFVELRYRVDPSRGGGA